MAKKTYYYKNGGSYIVAKSPLKPIPKGCVEITEEEYQWEQQNANNEFDFTRGPKQIYAEINEAKRKLAESDYKTAKRIEGYYTDDEWEEIKTEREKLRVQIRTLEEELKRYEPQEQ